MAPRAKAVLTVGVALSLVVLPVGASVDVGSPVGASVEVNAGAPSPSVERTTTDDRVRFGESVTVQLNVTVEQARSTVTIRDDYRPKKMEPLPWAASIESVRIDGESRPDRVERTAASVEDGVLVRVSDLDAGDTVTVTYRVRTYPVPTTMVYPPPNVTVPLTFTGTEGADVTADGATAEFANDTVTVTNGGGGGPSLPIVADGTVTDAELQLAIEMWVDGQASNDALQLAIDVWVESG